MNVIARKKGGIGIMYLLCPVAGLIMFFLGITDNNLYVWIMGAVIAIISGYNFVRYLALPKAVISVDNEGILCLPNGKTLDPADIIDVSYERASARGTQYQWGSVTIKTHIEEYKYNYIAECERVAKELTDMMYKSKYEK